VDQERRAAAAREECEREECETMIVTFHLVFVPLTLLIAFRLFRRRHFRTAFIFLFLAWAGYGLWLPVLMGRPFHITVFLTDMFDSLQRSLGFS
jgi:hypothetical protein